VVTTARLKRDIEELKSRRASRIRPLGVPTDRVEFFRAAGLEPDPWQAKVLRSDSKRLLLNCSRQSGKTTVVAAMALHKALLVPRSFTFVFAPSLDQSIIFCDHVKELSHQLGMGNVDPESLRQTGLELKNGSRIEARSGSERTAHGRTADLLVIDEASRIRDDLNYAVRPMLAVTGGALVMLSTPNGKRGVFYEAWTGAVAGWERYEVPAEECPRISPEFLEEEREALPSWVYRQEYECSFEETEDQVFTTEMVERAVTPEVTPLFGSG
jgi:terminase large subunit-like protein